MEIEDDLHEIFSRHNFKDAFKFEFNEASVEENKATLQRYQKKGHLNDIKDYYVTDKEVFPNDTELKEEKQEFSEYFKSVLELNHDNPYIYC